MKHLSEKDLQMLIINKLGNLEEKLLELNAYLNRFDKKIEQISNTTDQKNPNNAANLPKYLSLKQVKEYTTLNSASIYMLIKKGEFPKQKQFGPRRVFWIKEEVDNWLKNKIDKENQ